LGNLERSYKVFFQRVTFYLFRSRKFFTGQEIILENFQIKKKKKKSGLKGVLIVAQGITNPTSINEDAGSIPDLLPQWVKDLHCCGCGVGWQLQF